MVGGCSVETRQKQYVFNHVFPVLHFAGAKVGKLALKSNTHGKNVC
jgi:hypothetical protein